MNKINDWLALKCTLMTSSMWAAYLFCVLAFISLPTAVASHDAFTIVSWISQSFLQLVLLPIIMVGQNLLSQSTEQRAAEDHTAVMEIVQDIHQMMSEESTEAADLASILARLTAIEAAIATGPTYK